MGGDIGEIAGERKARGERVVGHFEIGARRPAIAESGRRAAVKPCPKTVAAIPALINRNESTSRVTMTPVKHPAKDCGYAMGVT
jgi:hypothetical protein